MTADCIMINVNLQNRDTRLNKTKKCKETNFFLSKILQPSNKDIYISSKQIKKKDRQKYIYYSI